MHTATLDGQSVTGSAARIIPPQPGAAASSSIAALDADIARLSNAIVNAWKRLDHAKRTSDFEGRIGAQDDIDRLAVRLADARAARRTMEG